MREMLTDDSLAGWKRGPAEDREAKGRNAGRKRSGITGPRETSNTYGRRENVPAVDFFRGRTVCASNKRVHLQIDVDNAAFARESWKYVSVSVLLWAQRDGKIFTRACG